VTVDGWQRPRKES